MKEYEDFFKVAEKPFIAAKQQPDREDSRGVSGDILEGTTKSVCVSLDEE